MKEIRNLKIKNRIFLAPMAEVNDIAFRLLCKEAGSGLNWTGMINPLTHKEIETEDFPILQIFCTNSKGVSDFVKKYESKVAGFDFNLGCPAKTARKLGFGSFMHNQIEEIEKILKTMRESTDKPIFIKLRKSKNVLKILKVANKYCDAICIHPRTQDQGYSGKADIEYALRIKKRTKLPVIYSGDVNKSNIEERLNQFDYVMIGRESLGNPNIFGKTNFGFLDYIRLGKKYKLKFSQYKMQAMCFTKGKENAKELRLKIVKARTIKELENIFSN